MGTKWILRVGVCTAVLGCGGVGYASLFGEENVTLWNQLTELIGIGNNTRNALHEARVGVDLAFEAADDARRARNLVTDLHSYTADRFLSDFKRDVLQTYPDLDYIIQKTSTRGLEDWKNSDMRSPMGSYELIGRVFGEVTSEMKSAQEDGTLQMEGPVLYRYEAAAALTTASDAEQFIDLADEDIDTLVEHLNGATKEEAIVLQAKIQAVVAAQNSHMLRLLARMVRREGVEDARHYQRSMQSLEMGMDMEKGAGEMADLASERPVLMQFDPSWLE